MTDQIQSESVTNAPSVEHVPAQTSPEPSLPQSEVNKLVGKIRSEAYQKGFNEGSAKPHYSPPQEQPVVTQQSTQPQYVGGIPQQTPEQIRQLVQEENLRMQQVNQYQQSVNSFVSKVNAARERLTDFDQVAGAMNLPQIPIIWQSADQFDNAPDIIYHLGKNPSKLSQLLAVSYAPEMVKLGMQEISNSLKQNAKAEAEKDENNAPAPLGHPKPSNVGMGNGASGNLSVADYKKIYRT